MNIYEAVKSASEQGKSISIKDHGEVWFKVTPRELHTRIYLSDGNGDNPVIGWEPTLDELISTDWEVVD